MTSLFFMPLSHLTVDCVFLFRRLVIVFKESPGEKKVSPVGAVGDCSLTNPIPSPHLLLLPTPVLLYLFLLLLSFPLISHTCASQKQLLLTIHLPAQWISLFICSVPCVHIAWKCFHYGAVLGALMMLSVVSANHHLSLSTSISWESSGPGSTF